ncbi:MAG: thioesterase family protein [Acidobacteria bacterium]|nr:thioesterase family protein [Acidobacteriota bacterium]
MPTSSCQIRVRYAETDKMGIAYYANYFVWFEVARCELLRSLGGRYRDLEANGVLLPVVEAQCSYRAPARYDDDLDVVTTGSMRSRARVAFQYEVRRHADQSLLAVGHTVHAATDPSGRLRRVPADLQAILT